MHFTPGPKINKSSVRPCIMAQGMGTQKEKNNYFGDRRGGGEELNELLIICCIFYYIFLFVGTAPYPSPRCVQSWFSDKAMAS